MKTMRDIVIEIIRGTDFWSFWGREKKSKTFRKMYRLSLDMIWRGEY